jgi:hypothetical protein
MVETILSVHRWVLVLALVLLHRFSAPLWMEQIFGPTIFVYYQTSRHMQEENSQEKY